MRMIFCIKFIKQSLKVDNSILCQFLKRVVDGGQSLLRNVISNVFEEINVADSFSIVGEVLPDGSDLLSGEEDSKGIEE